MNALIATAVSPGEILAVALFAIFVFVGLGALVISTWRHREQMAIVAWFGAFSLLYGIRLFAESDSFTSLLPGGSRRFIIAGVTYIILVPALLFWRELSTPPLRRLINALVIAALFVFLLAIGDMVRTGRTSTFMPANNVLAIVLILSAAIVNLVPALARKYLIIRSTILAIGSAVLAAAVLYANLSTFFRYSVNGLIEPPAFAVFVFSIGYAAIDRVITNERRLLSIDRELAVAREIQNSILPAETPTVHGLRIAAAYYPMASVAGDFYEFLPIDDRRAGFFIADVSGHGVPAALIASMIKVAMNTVQPHAAHPGRVLAELNAILTQQLKGQFVTAGYLYLDLDLKLARYSGAGHPPLLHWDSAKNSLDRIESNGLLFGVMKQADYPTTELSIRNGDRFLLYTDGLIEPENAAGEPFGDARIAAVLEQSRSNPAAALSAILFEQMSRWQPPKTPQQDDVSLIVIDVL